MVKEAIEDRSEQRKKAVGWRLEAGSAYSYGLPSCLTLLVLILPTVLHAADSRPVRPNILFILSDDMGYSDTGVYGCKDIPTPNIDRIASRGVRFTDAYANGSFCTPTRAALMSGRYQQRCGNEDLANVTGPLPLAVTTLPQRLHAAGYTTGMVGKWHLGGQAGFTPVDRGFDEFFGFLGGGHQYIIKGPGKGEYNAPILRNREPVAERRYLTDAFGEEAAAFLERQRDSQKPFFLYLAFNAVHTPLQATEKYLQRFAHIEDQRRRTYAAMLSAMDDAIGLVLTKLEQIGKLDNTLIIFNNDNGGAVNNGSINKPLRGFKIDTWEGGIRVPLLVWWPGVLQAGSVYRQPVITMDLTAMVLAAAGARTDGIEGVNLLPFLKGENSGSPHEALFWRCRTKTADNCYAVRRGDWVYVHTHRYSEDGTGRGPAVAPERLFHLADDLGEKRDLAAEQPAKLAELKRLYEAWSAEVDADCRKLGIEPQGPEAAVPARPMDAARRE